jgi:DegV family protein with EDD domain
MDYKIVVDSCGELTQEMKDSGVFESIPLTIELGGEVIRDDETFNQAEFLKKTAACPEAPKSSCPSPEEFKESYKGDVQRVYVVTLSDKLSGTYNSAELAKTLYHEENPKKMIHIFNSFSASVGETLAALKIWECEKAGMSYQQVVESVKKCISGINTYFVLETLDTIRKSGRLTGVKAIVSSALNIKPVMGSTDEGTIQHLGQGRGIKKALVKMVDQIVKDVKDPENKILAISHCNCMQRALEVKDMLLSKIKVKNIVIVDTSGISTMYANDGGVVVAI